MITHTYDKELKLAVNSSDFEEKESVNVTLRLQDYNHKDIKVIKDTTSIENSVARYPFVIKDLVEEAKLDQVKYVKGWIDTDGNEKLTYDEEVKLKLDNGYKIRIIFKASESDRFINEFESLDLTKIKINLYDLKDHKKVKDLHDQVIGNIKYIKNEENKDKEGFIYELPMRYAQGAYALEFILEDKSVFFPIQYALQNSNTTISSLHKIKERSIPFGCHDSFLFQDEQSREEYIDIVVTLGVNIIIECEAQGASNAYLKQGDEMRTAVVPMIYKSKYYTEDTGKEDFEPNHDRINENEEFPSTKEIIEKHFPSLTIQRANSNFEEFLNNNLGSIDFKVVNYRKYIYTGDKKHCLNGDGWMEGSRAQRKHHEPFETGVEEKNFVHTEYIKQRVFILLEVQEKNYLLNKKNIFKTQLAEIISFEKLIKQFNYNAIYIADDKAETKDKVSDVHQTFIHLAFDGKELKVKEILLEQVKDNKGTLELITPNIEKKSQDNSSSDFEFYGP